VDGRARPRASAKWSAPDPVCMTGDRDRSFRFDYDSPVLTCGRGRTADLGTEVATLGCDRALVVTGRTVGTTDAVMDPVRAGLGDRLADVFAETTPEKRFSTAVDGLRAMEAADADALVAVGGGSSLDIAKGIAALAAADDDPETMAAEFEASGLLPVTGPTPPLVAVPTTLAGADLSTIAGITATPDEGFVETEVGGACYDRRLMPATVVFDADLFATTPAGVLAGSALNGFDKGVETLYAATATPVTDATAMRGLGVMREGLLAWAGEGGDDESADGSGRDERDPDDALDRVVEGYLLVQYGISRPDEMTVSVVHAFGHGLRHAFGMQQGTAHAVMVPHVLEHIFETGDGRRDLLAAALGVDDADDPAAAVVDAVAEVRDALGLPARLRDVEGTDRDALPEVATAVVEDSFMANGPPGYDPDTDAIERVLDAAW
jgi:alcohol dehydrogenase class IV